MDASTMEESSEGIKRMSKKTKNALAKTTLLLIGFMILIAGLTLILAWWPDVVRIFRGALGIVLALIGMFILYAVK